MMRLIYTLLLFTLNISNFYLAKQYVIHPTFDHRFLFWLGLNVIVMILMCIFYAKVVTNDGIPFLWIVFSFTIPYFVADYVVTAKGKNPLDYLNKKFGTEPKAPTPEISKKPNWIDQINRPVYVEPSPEVSESPTPNRSQGSSDRASP